MKQFDHGYALLIGVNESNVQKWALPNILKDIEALNNVLTDPERCAYSPENIKLVTGKNATKEGILDGLKWMEKKISEDYTENATAIIYYSGHGWRKVSSGEAEYYLIPYDIEERSVTISALSSKQFSASVAIVEPRRLLVMLDCCHAGGMGVKDLDSCPHGFNSSVLPFEQFKNEGKSLFEFENKKNDKLSNGSGRVILCSSSDIQKSYMCSDGSMSIFTKHIVEALSGYARPNINASEVLVSDIIGYISRKVKESANAIGLTQEPYNDMTGKNFPIALLEAELPIALINDTECKKSATMEIEKGLLNLHKQEYDDASLNFLKAKELLPTDENTQFFYCLSQLVGKPLLSIKKSKMNEISSILLKITQKQNSNKESLVRILLGIIWYDYYLKVDHKYNNFFFMENVRYLRNCRITDEERQLVNHIIFSDGAKSMFNIN